MRVSEPRFVAEVVDGGKRAAAVHVSNLPVVAACSNGDVVGRDRVEVPAVPEGVDDGISVEVLRRRPHRSTVQRLLVQARDVEDDDLGEVEPVDLGGVAPGGANPYV
jgi:hypothetical protein